MTAALQAVAPLGSGGDMLPIFTCSVKEVVIVPKEEWVCDVPIAVGFQSATNNDAYWIDGSAHAGYVYIRVDQTRMSLQTAQMLVYELRNMYRFTHAAYLSFLGMGDLTQNSLVAGMAHAAVQNLVLSGAWLPGPSDFWADYRKYLAFRHEPAILPHTNPAFCYTAKAFPLKVLFLNTRTTGCVYQVEHKYPMDNEARELIQCAYKLYQDEPVCEATRKRFEAHLRFMFHDGLNKKVFRWQKKNSKGAKVFNLFTQNCASLHLEWRPQWLMKPYDK